MALPQTQCCRAIRRRLRSPCDSALLPESALVSAFEQVCSISRVTSRRNGSNVPGPLENRRRTGKRHMGELNFGHLNAPAPFWELANAVDLTQWKWTPPSSFEARHAQQEQGESKSFLASLQSWVSRTQTPSTAYADGLDPFLPSIASVEAVAPVSSPDAVRVVERAATPSARELPSATLNGTFDAEWLNEKALDAMFPEQFSDDTLTIFCNGLYTAVAEETIDRDTLASFLKRITDAAYNLAANSNGTITIKRCSSLLLRLYTTINDGLHATSNARDGYFDDDYKVFATLLVATSRLEINSLVLFGKIMANIPAERLVQCKYSIVMNINGFLDALSQHAISNEKKERKTIVRQITKMAGCLSSLDSRISQHQWILQRISLHLLNQLEANPIGHEASRCNLMRSAWLQLLARLPQVEDDYLVEVCNMLESSSSAGPLTQRQICELFLTRINSRYSVKHISNVNRQLKSSPESACYATVSSSLWKTGQHRYLKMLANLLQRLGRQQDIRHVAHGLRKHVHNDIQPLANLAIGLGHPQLAVWVYFRYHQSRWKSKNFWNTNFAQEILNKLMESNEMSTEKMLDALKINPTRPQRSTRESCEEVIVDKDSSHLTAKQQRMKPRLTLQRIRQTEKIAAALASTRHISDREAFRRITRCIEFLQSHNTPLTPPILRALFDVVTRDLEAGKPGRTSRLKWFLGLLLKETDANYVRAVGLALKDWRRQLG
ncbi:hypothetical protein PFICI_01872 [Pestalotiopsis fici W106-1]|uniref:Uncharacterized protein n=1 Tax=Pestalotiopsis fici (strain W106-1 / CGMCC3.15140) TaxID=1229662 RepID=W3XPX8_PESFW|nr:uncharacterized protein PFICI_01872 [Pestalotiopsis fici W106-1]ETS88044.1 hypothetical protein PFICI_01872 [Pestalotiopsis fici W106-1]